MRYRVFYFLTAAVVALGIGGCAGEGKSYDPKGTDSLTFGEQGGASILQLDPNQAAQLTAKVTDAAGKAVAEREVTFEILSNGSGATINATRVNTNTAGEATILYIAGAVNGFDIVRGSLSNGARVDVSITVGGGAGGTQISLAAAPTSVTTGLNSILTATVTDSAGSPVQGLAVTFAFSANNSGATLVTLSGTTDVSGNALALYTAGSALPGQSISDTISAAVPGAVTVTIITRLASATAGNRIASLTASPSGLSASAAGGSSIITASVVGSDNITPVPGETVTFSVTGVGTAPPPAVTGNDGRAVSVFTYTGGATSGTQSVVQARIAGGSAAVIINWVP